MIKVLIADDHAIVRRGLKEILGKTRDIIVAGEATNGKEALDKLKEQNWDMLILDIKMPDKNGFEILQASKTIKPQLPVLMLSVYSEEEYATAAFKAGAAGYITKDADPEELLKAIRKVYEGGKYVSSSYAERMAFSLRTALDKQPHELLSDREYQILCLMASGKTVSEIATDLSLSIKTVSTYRARILEKMNLTTNAQITKYAINAGIVT